jgi:hypothetical protein
MSYCDYSASIPQTSPFELYSQTSFGSDLKIGQPTHFQLNLLQQQQQALQAGHLKQQLCLKLQHSGSQQLQRLRVSWLLIWGALLVAAVVAVLLAFTPLGWPVLPHQHQSWSSSQTAIQHGAAGMVRNICCLLLLIAFASLQNQAGPARCCAVWWSVQSGLMWTLAQSARAAPSSACQHNSFLLRCDTCVSSFILTCHSLAELC